MQTRANEKTHEELAKKLHRRSFIEKYRFEERLFEEKKITMRPSKPSEEAIKADWVSREPIRALWCAIAEEAANHLRM